MRKKADTTKEKSVHYLTKEGMYFEDFIISALQLMKVHLQRESILLSPSKYFIASDAFLNSGLPGITDGKTYLEIKYTNSPDAVFDFIERMHLTKRDYKFVIITLLSEVDLKQFKDIDNIVVLGSSYVFSLIKRYPSEWWIFVASCSDVNQIYYDQSDNSIHITNPPLAAKVLGKTISLKVTDKLFEHISIIGENDFKRRIDHFKNPAIFIGNGASIHFGSDSWEEMSNTLFDYLKPNYIDNKDKIKKAIGNNTYSLTSASKYLIDKKKYYLAIYNSIYRKYEKSMHIDNTIIRSISRIKHKKQAIPLVTYNYDSFLELDYSQVFSIVLPSVCNKRQDNLIKEPKILHVHGFIPYGRLSKHSNLILTQEEYYSAYKGNNWVVKKQKDILTNNTCIFVGSSMSDLFQMSVLNNVRSNNYSASQPYSWKCFAIFCLKDLTPKDITAVYNYYFSKGVHIIIVDNFAKIPEKLLSLFGMQ